MSKKCRAYSESKLGLEPADNRKAFYAGWDAALADHIVDANKMVEQPAQEPVAWYGVNIAGVKYLGWKYEELDDRGFDVFPLYTSPPASKPWVGLSTVELDEIDAPIRERGHATVAEIYRAIEAKLREKNTGETK